MPLTVCRVLPETRFLVVEMGARGIGHIEYLTDIAPPHDRRRAQRRHGPRRRVRLARGHRPGQGRARDRAAAGRPGGAQRRRPRGARRWRARPRARVAARRHERRAPSVRAAGHRARRRPVAPPSPCPAAASPSRRRVSLPLHGEHHVGNALAVIAVALECGLRPRRDRRSAVRRHAGQPLADGGHRAPGRRHRRQRRLQRQPRLDAGRAQGARARWASGRRTWAVLGSMLELGDESTTEHDAVGRLAVRLDVSRLVVVGETARPMATGAQHEGSWGDEAVWVPDADAAYDLLQRELSPRRRRAVQVQPRRRTTVARRPTGRPGCPDAEDADVKAVLHRGRRLARHRAVRHADVHPVPRAPRLRPVHPRRRPHLAPHQARHAHDGRRGHHRRRRCSRYGARPPGHR